MLCCFGNLGHTRQAHHGPPGSDWTQGTRSQLGPRASQGSSLSLSFAAEMGMMTCSARSQREQHGRETLVPLYPRTLTAAPTFPGGQR